MKVIRGLQEEGIGPERGELIDLVRVKRPAIVIDFIVAKKIEVDDGTPDERIILSTLFGRDYVDIGRGVSVVGNVQSNGTIIIRDNTEVFGNVVGKKVEIGSNVNILGNVIAESDITVGEGSKIGGYVSSLKGMVKLSRNVEVFDVFGGSGTVLGSGVNIVDYTVYSKGSTVVEDKVYIANYEIDAPEIIELGAGLNLLQVLPTSRYSPEAALKYLRENIRSIVDIKTYLRENNIKPDEIEVKMRTAQMESIIESAMKVVRDQLLQNITSVGGHQINLSNVTGPVTITIGNNNSVSVGSANDSGENKYRVTNLVELFNHARKSITEGDLYEAYSSLQPILEASKKEGNTPPELEELIRMIETRLKVRESVISSEETRKTFLSLLDSAYKKMMKV